MGTSSDTLALRSGALELGFELGSGVRVRVRVRGSGSSSGLALDSG